MSSVASSQWGDVPPSPPQHVVIAGSGIIGTCTAYYLSKMLDTTNAIPSITMIDPTGTIAPAASGKAGGFLALDWNDASPTQELTRRSFALHQELADELGADSIQYRRLTCSAISCVDDGGTRRRPSGKKLEGIEWAQSEEGSSVVSGVRLLGNERTIAQVHPKRLCERLWEETIKLTSGRAKLLKGKVISAVHDYNGKLLGAKLEDESIVNADALLFACGPWTASMMKGIKYHSVIIPTDRVLSQCVFFSGCGDPEVYVRPDSTAYCTGFPDDAIPVTERPGEECVRPETIARILESVRAATGSDSSSTTNSNTSYGALSKEPVVQQACYLPTTNDGIPVMGEIPHAIAGGSKCYIATGHTCWGILLGPASGHTMASLIATGKGSIDMSVFEPKRFRSFQLVPK